MINYVFLRKIMFVLCLEQETQENIKKS